MGEVFGRLIYIILVHQHQLQILGRTNKLFVLVTLLIFLIYLALYLQVGVGYFKAEPQLHQLYKTPLLHITLLEPIAFLYRPQMLMAQV